MDANELKEIKDAITDYKHVKYEIRKKINQIRQDVKYMKKNPWDAEVEIDQLLKGICDTPQARKFSELAGKTKNNNDYEKHFRSAYLEIFDGINIEPLEL